jgi:AhpD family alkylhydroperoxidase
VIAEKKMMPFLCRHVRGFCATITAVRESDEQKGTHGMTTARMIPDEEATGLVREVYDDIKATKGIDFVPNIWRALAVNPEHLSATWFKLKQTMAAGALDPLTKELIAIAVSATNGCRYCINSHTGAAVKLGMDTRMFSELLAVVDVFNGTNRLADAYQVEPDAYPEVPPPK